MKGVVGVLNCGAIGVCGGCKGAVCVVGVCGLGAIGMGDANGLA